MPSDFKDTLEVLQIFCTKICCDSFISSNVWESWKKDKIL